MTAATYPGPETIHRHVLDNGITVLIYENMLSNTVAIEGVVRAGAVVEPAMQAGLADFTADLLIRGSSRWAFEGIAEALELSLIHISEPTRPYSISYAVFCL